jgi:hypothetical protein
MRASVRTRRVGACACKYINIGWNTEDNFVMLECMYPEESAHCDVPCVLGVQVLTCPLFTHVSLMSYSCICVAEED